MSAKLDTAEVAVLVALVEQGPLWDGDLPSKVGRDGLLAKGLIAKVVARAEDGWQAATYAGRDAYKDLFPGVNGPAETIHGAQLNRRAVQRLNWPKRG